MADQTFAVHCGFFDAINSDRTYSADEMNRPYRRIISNGVFATPQGDPSTDLQVVESTGMNIICKAGEGLFADKWFENPSSIVITVPNNTSTVPRIDSVLVQVDTRTSGRVGNIVHRTGTPASSPTPPVINQTEGVVEYRLANIRVNAGVTSILGRYITDRRGSSDCPWVTSLIYQVDTSTLYDQWQAAYAEYFEQEKAIWDAWYAQLTEDLDVSMTLDRHVNTVTTTAQTTGTIPIGLAYNHNTDILEVYINGLRAIEGTHYIVVNDDTSIMVENQLDIGQAVTFVVMRSVISGSATNITVLLQELESQIAGIAGGTPTVVDAKADMTDTGKIYILSSDSKWYYYSATQEDWVIGGTYGGVPTDSTLTQQGRAADAKAVGDAIDAVEGDVDALESEFEAKVASRYGEEYSPNLVENAESMTSGYLGLDGAHHDASTMAYTDYIPVKTGWVLRAYFVKSGVLTPKDLRFVTCYDSEKTAMASAGATNVASFTVPSGVAYIRVTYTGVSELVTNYQLSANFVATSYSAYTPVSALIDEDFLTIESSDLIENLKSMTDAYGIALPKTTIRQTVGIAEKWYYASAVTPDSTRCAISAGTQYTSLDDTGITFLNTSAYSSANGYRYRWYDVFLSLIESGDGDAGYGWARKFTAENLSDCSLLCIGDSTVDHDTMTATILSHFAEQGATVTLLGTLGDGSGTNKNEGRAGWKATDYLTDKTYNGVVNPFYNPSTQTFDFSYYMSNQGYTGVDFVVLQLGINDLYNNYTGDTIESTWTAMEMMIDSILSYNSGVKIILNLPTTPNSDQSKHSVPEFLYRNCVIRYNEYAMAHALSKYGTNSVRCSYCHLILDPDTEIRDNVHPTVAGYQKMGLEVCNQINNWQNT